ncbi:MAG TPA: DUF1801 domain-containing protein [Nitrososphaerales archaeon]|nr:DUF1801 domain-containing protein [Nitrososphaerales archaeon]
MNARTSPSRKGRAPPRLMGSRIKGQGDWRVKTLSQLRALIKKADPAAVEEVKWRKPTNPKGVPVWSHDGIICTGGILKDAVRLTFLKGAQMKDPKKLFNASLQGNALRAIDFHKGDTLDEASFDALVLEAVGLNKLKMRERSVLGMAGGAK